MFSVVKAAPWEMCGGSEEVGSFANCASRRLVLLSESGAERTHVGVEID